MVIARKIATEILIFIDASGLSRRRAARMAQTCVFIKISKKVSAKNKQLSISKKLCNPFLASPTFPARPARFGPIRHIDFGTARP
jgi:hypothetical protein